MTTLDEIRLQSGSLPPGVRDIPFPLLPRNEVYTLKRTYDGGIISTSAALPSFYQFSFTLAQLPDFSEITNLFDSYRFKCVRVNFTPIENNVLPSASRLLSVIDYDDAAAITINQAYEYDSLQISSISNGTRITRVLVPKFAVASYSGAFTSFSQSLPGQWIDTASATVQYYGLKVAVDPSTAVTNIYTTNIEVLVQCRNTR